MCRMSTELLNRPGLNKGKAFTEGERGAHGLLARISDERWSIILYRTSEGAKR
jgi:hypothetical protein